MEKLKLISFNDPLLKRAPALFDFEKENAEEISERLFIGMRQFGGVGLSANQVGLDVRCFVMKTADAGNKTFFNPEITRLSQETELQKEGCLSFPDLFLMIKRARVIEMKYQDSDGTEHTLILDGLGARCAQHEIDHLNGLTIYDREFKLTPLVSEKKYGRNEIITISKGTETLELKYKKGIPYLTKGWKING